MEALVPGRIASHGTSNRFGLQRVLWVVPFVLLVGDVWGMDWVVLGSLVCLVPSCYGFLLHQAIGEGVSVDRVALLTQACALLARVIVVVWGIGQVVGIRCLRPLSVRYRSSRAWTIPRLSGTRLRETQSLYITDTTKPAILSHSDLLW